MGALCGIQSLACMLLHGVLLGGGSVRLSAAQLLLVAAIILKEFPVIVLSLTFHH